MPETKKNTGVESAQAESREHIRDAVQIVGELFVSEGARFKVLVADLSQSGFRIETANYIDVNRIVYLTIPGFQPLKARVAWHYKEQFGCELANKMHNAVFLHISSAFPLLVSNG